MGSHGLQLPTGLMTGYSTMAGKIGTTPPPCNPNLMPSDLYLFASITKHSLASKLQQMLMCSKLSPSGYRHLIQVSSAMGYKSWYHGGTNAEMSMVNTCGSEVQHLPPLFHVYTTHLSQNKVLGIKVFLYLIYSDSIALNSTWHTIPEDSMLQQHCCVNLKYQNRDGAGECGKLK